jgi:hypothetical protein
VKLRQIIDENGYQRYHARCDVENAVRVEELESKIAYTVAENA